MPTRGLFGFYYQGKYYLVYNHYDSYPNHLGMKLVKELRTAIQNNKIEEWLSLLKNIKIVTNGIDTPSDNDIKKLQKYTDLSVGNQSTNDWYCLLRNCQESFETVLESGYFLNNQYDRSSLTNDIFIEYSYVLNFDDKTLDFYKGMYCGGTTKGKYKFDKILDENFNLTEKYNSDNDPDPNSD